MKLIYLAIIAGVMALTVSSVPQARSERSDAHARPEPAVALEQGHADGHDDICSGGPANVVDARLEIAGFESSSGRGDSLRLELALDSHYQGKAHSIASIEVFDDRGNPITEPEFSTLLPLETHGSTRFATTTPPGLAHGFYRVSASIASEAAAAAEGADRPLRSFDTAQLFLRVDEDGIAPLGHDEWLMQSNAHLAVQTFDQPDPEGATLDLERSAR